MSETHCFGAEGKQQQKKPCGCRVIFLVFWQSAKMIEMQQRIEEHL
jgi:hypothetical protein